MRNKSMLVWMVAISVAGCAAPAATGGDQPTMPSGLSITDAARDQIRDQVQADVDSGAIAGAVVLLATSDETLMFESFGSQSLEDSVPMANDTVFRIFSMTKPITSTAVMMLHERGHFDLDDPIAVYLPELADLEVGVEVVDDDGDATLTTEPADTPVTIRDLLRHTSGMTYGLFGESMVDRMYVRTGILGAADLPAMVTAISQVPLKYHPGKVFEYGVSTDVLARLVEVISEQPFDQFLHENIFQPLEMDDTAFWVAPENLGRYAGYYEQGEDGLVATAETTDFTVEPTLYSGGGGLVSTTADYLRFCRMILGNGELSGVRILQPETVALMSQDHLADLPGVDGGPVGGAYVTGFGLGFALTPEAGPGSVSAGTLYWGGYAGTGFWIDPTQDLIGIYMTQSFPPLAGYRWRFRDLVYQTMAAVETMPAH